MKVLIDVNECPDHVRDYIRGLIGGKCRSQCGPTATENTATENTATENTPQVEVEPPTMDEVLQAAKEYMHANGPHGLKDVLHSLEVPAVSKCPPEKLAALLSKLVLEGKEVE